MRDERDAQGLLLPPSTKRKDFCEECKMSFVLLERSAERPDVLCKDCDSRLPTGAYIECPSCERWVRMTFSCNWCYTEVCAMCVEQ